EHHATGAPPMRARPSVRMDVDFVRAPEAQTAGTLHAIAGMMHPARAHATVAALVAGMMAAVAGTVAVVALRGQGDQREVVRARPEKTTMTTTARADVALFLPTAQD